MFSTGGAGGEGQRVPDPARGRRLGRVPGRVPRQRRLTQSPRLFTGPGRSRARLGPLSQPLAQSFWLISLFFSMQKRKTPNDTAAYNLLAAGRLLGNCDGGASRLGNAFPSAWQGRGSDFLRHTASWEHKLFLASASGTAWVPTPTHSQDMETQCSP